MPTNTHASRVAAVMIAAGFAEVMQPSSLAAQSFPPGQGVADRPRPAFDPLGIDVASFRLFPGVDANVHTTDNFRASNTNRQGDVYLLVVPALRVKSDWTRNSLDARAYFSRSIHARLASENVSQYGASAAGTIDVTRLAQINIDAAADHKTEGRASLGSFQGAPSPVNFNTYRIGISGAQAFNRLVINAGAAYEKRDFADVVAGNGTIIDQDFRDVRTLSATASARFEIRSGVSALVSGQFDDSRFPTPSAGNNSLRRDSTGYSLLAGVSLELSSLVFGDIQVGFIDRRYRDPRLKDVNGPSYRANLLWNVTPLTSLRLTGARTVEDAASTSFAGNTRSDLGLAIDHELYRYVIVSANTRVSHFSANGPGATGDEFDVGLGARYLIGRRWSINARLAYAQRRSSDPRLAYNATSVSIGGRLGF